jgi:class 3 adenylate cyclase/tetratricopeptide (TPR) repeat protein
VTEDLVPTTATVVFTDMVGSTALRSDLGEERADQLRRIHDHLLTEVVTEHHGRVIKGGGDGLMATFASASDAVGAAVDMQRSVWRYSARPDAMARFSIRVGISVGDVTWEGGDCFGTPVVEAARLEQVAEGGQILCSDYVRAMARGRGGHDFTSIGDLELKGLPDAVAACTVNWEPAQAGVRFPAALTVASPYELVGRGEELVTARALLAGHRGFRFLWLAGEPGIGKTRLAAELAIDAHAAGCDVLFGHVDETLRVPYRAFVESLRAYTDTPNPSLGDMADELTRIVPEMRSRLGLGQPIEGDPETEQYRLFEAVAQWLTAAARERPLMVVLDDLHWATPETLQLLRHLSLCRAELGPAVIVTYRPAEAPGELGQLVDDLADNPGSLVIRPRGLTSADITRLVGIDRGSLAVTVHEQTAGNPFFVTAMLSHLEHNDDGSLPEDVHTAVRRRVSKLAPDMQHALRVGSLLGLEFDLRLVAHACATSTAGLIDGIEQARRAGIIEEYGANTFRFAHALVRGTLADQLGPTRRVAVHRQLAEAIERLHLPQLDDHIEALAYHYTQVAQTGECVDEAVQYLIHAARRAAHQAAHQEALQAYRAALAFIEQAGGATVQACELQLAIGRLHRQSGELTSARDILSAGAAQAASAGWRELHAELAIEWQMTYSLLGEQHPAPVAALEAALTAADELDPVARARLSLWLAIGYQNLARHDDAVSVGREAMAIAEDSGDPLLLDAAAYAVWSILPGPGHVDARARLIERCVNVSLEAGREEAAQYHMWSMAQTMVQRCDGPSTRRWIASYADLAEKLRDTLGTWMVKVYQAMIAILEGRLDDAETLAIDAESQAGGHLRGRDPSGVLGVQMFTIRREQGRLAEVAPIIRMLAARGSEGTWRPGLAALYAELGMLDEAAAELAHLLGPEGPLYPLDSRWEASTSYVADVAVALRDERAAAIVYDSLVHYRDMSLSMPGIACYGPAARYLGMLALTMGRADEAERHLRHSLELCDRLGAPIWRAHTERWLTRLAPRGLSS